MIPLLPIQINGISKGKHGSPILSFLIRTILYFVALQQCHAARPRLARMRIGCATANPTVGDIVPKLADCRTVIQHLPLVQGGSLYPLTTALGATPFLPPLSMRHDTCRYHFSYAYDFQRHQPGITPDVPKIPIEAVWRVMRLGAIKIADQCGPDRKYGNLEAQVELEVEGWTRIYVSNLWTREMQAWEEGLIHRSRERLGMNMTAAGALRMNYDNSDARYDRFASPSFEV